MAKRFFTPIDLTGTIGGASAPERSIKWNDGEGTLEVGLKGGNIKLPVGQEEITLCYNGTGGTLTKGTVVYISGAQGQRPSVSKASASSESTSSKTFGIVSENIANGAEGFVTTFGAVAGVNTSSFTEGSALWLSTTAGEITQTPPTAPNHLVFIGYCLKSNASSGRIFVKVQNGYELDELHNVLITSPSTGQVLEYDSATGLWKNSDPAEGAVFEVFYQSSAPSNPQLGDIWVDSDENLPDYDNISINTLLPNQSGNSGKFLTTNGSAASWAAIDLSSYATTASLSSYATLNSPTFTGTPLAPTASPGTNTTQIATTEFVKGEITSLIDSAPSSLDTLNELAAALNDDANFATTVTNSLAGKEPTITAGITSQYWRGDKTWQTLDKSSVGLGNVENTALSTWSGSSNITSVGTINSGIWQGSSISTTYTDAKVTSVNGATGAITGLATLASPSFTGTISLNSQADLIFKDDSNIAEGRIVAGFGALYIQAGTSSVDGVASMSISRYGTTTTSIASFNVYADTTTFSGRVVSLVSTNSQTGTAYTLVLSDQSKLIEINNSSANTLTIPLNSSVAFPVGTKIDIVQTGTGQTTIVPTSGVTMNSYEGANKLSGQWAAASLIKRDTNTWALIGNITT